MGKQDETLEQQLANTQYGLNAKVTRDKVRSEDAARANVKLREIGQSLNPNPNLEYMGSAAFHVYQSEKLEYVMFVEQTDTLGGTPEVTTQKALENFRGSLMTYHGQKRQRRRSGF